MYPKAEILFTRRCIRQYRSGANVSESDIQFLLDAAMSAPSARNRQPWHFVVINSKELLNQLSLAHPYAKMLCNAALAILVCGDTEIEPEEGYLVQACAAATQNILLATEAMGLGAVWLGVHPRQERMEMVSQLLKLPEKITPVALISIGYPSENKPRNANYQQSRVHFNTWG